jgi:hypothetical protein
MTTTGPPGDGAAAFEVADVRGRPGTDVRQGTPGLPTGDQHLERNGQPRGGELGGLQGRRQGEVRRVVVLGPI